MYVSLYRRCPPAHEFLTCINFDRVRNDSAHVIQNYDVLLAKLTASNQTLLIENEQLKEKLEQRDTDSNDAIFFAKPALCNRSIGYRNNPQPLAKSVRLMYLTVFDTRVASTPSPLPSPLDTTFPRST